jgi:2-(1,2-epoxy-1,2-dihydrophenyl)acetyl-CoA isomerase
MTNQTVLFENVGKTAVITLNRPQCKNAMDVAMREALAAAIDAARRDATVRSVVLIGAGADFCAGADLRGAAPTGEKVFAGREVVLDFHAWFGALVDLEKPVIAAVDGVAAGAGLSLALAADFVFATPRARLMSAFARIGLVPDLSLLYLLPRLVGLRRAKEIVFNPGEISVDDALAMRLVQDVVPAECLRDHALAYARRFDDASAQALGLAKTILNRSFETDRQTLTQLEAAAQSLCAASDYHAEALRRFQSGKAGTAG